MPSLGANNACRGLGKNRVVAISLDSLIPLLHIMSRWMVLAQLPCLDAYRFLNKSKAMNYQILEKIKNFLRLATVAVILQRLKNSLILSLHFCTLNKRTVRTKSIYLRHIGSCNFLQVFPT